MLPTARRIARNRLDDIINGIVESGISEPNALAIVAERLESIYNTRAHKWREKTRKFVAEWKAESAPAAETSDTGECMADWSRMKAELKDLRERCDGLDVRCGKASHDFLESRNSLSSNQSTSAQVTAFNPETTNKSKEPVFAAMTAEKKSPTTERARLAKDPVVLFSFSVSVLIGSFFLDESGRILMGILAFVSAAAGLIFWRRQLPVAKTTRVPVALKGAQPEFGPGIELRIRPETPSRIYLDCYRDGKLAHWYGGAAPEYILELVRRLVGG